METEGGVEEVAEEEEKEEDGSLYETEAETTETTTETNKRKQMMMMANLIGESIIKFTIILAYCHTCSINFYARKKISFQINIWGGRGVLPHMSCIGMCCIHVLSMDFSSQALKRVSENDIFCRVWVWKTEQHTPTKISDTYP